MNAYQKWFVIKFVMLAYVCACATVILVKLS